MNRKRQKILKETFAGKSEGEAPRQKARGSELEQATKETEIPGTLTMMEEIVSQENAKKALKKVLQNKGAPGVDGMPVEKLPEHLKENWSTIRHQLLTGTYTPKAVRRVEIPKPGGDRKSVV